jgi:hypothetical protein
MERLSQRSVAMDGETPVPQPDFRSLELRIKRTVRRDTGGGMKGLEVHVDREGIRLRGRCVSFYCKQLAQTAAMRLSGGVRVFNSIEVEND